MGLVVGDAWAWIAALVLAVLLCVARLTTWRGLWLQSFTPNGSQSGRETHTVFQLPCRNRHQCVDLCGHPDPGDCRSPVAPPICL